MFGKIDKLILAFAVFGLLAASAKSNTKTYSVNLAETARVGSVTLQPGEYHLKIEQGKAVFSANTLKQPVEAPVVVNSADKKYDQTAVVLSKDTGGVERISEIMLHGTTMKLDFPN